MSGPTSSSISAAVAWRCVPVAHSSVMRVVGHAGAGQLGEQRRQHGPVRHRPRQVREDDGHPLAPSAIRRSDGPASGRAQRGA